MHDDLGTVSGDGLFAGGPLAGPEFLVRASPERVRAAMAAAAGPRARSAAAVYRASAHLHGGADAATRRGLLAVDAARYGDRELSVRLNSVPVPGHPAAQWNTDWATGTLVDHRLHRVLDGGYPELPGLRAPVEAAFATVGGRVLVVLGTGQRVELRDPATGRRMGERFTVAGHREGASAVTVMDDRPVAVEGGLDGVVRVWDLSSGRQVGKPGAGHGGPISSVATAVVEGVAGRLRTRARTRLIAVSAGHDATLRVWDLAAGRGLGKPLVGHVGGVRAVAITMLQGRPVIVSGGEDATVRVWDLTAGRQRGEPLTGHTEPITTLATTVLDGRPVAVTAGKDATVRAWDLTAGRQRGEPLTGHTEPITTLATTVLDGRPVAVTAGK
ncbi:hypothetical protein AB0J08_37170, partial [Kitasatospora sp. NPDC050463]